MGGHVVVGQLTAVFRVVGRCLLSERLVSVFVLQSGKSLHLNLCLNLYFKALCSLKHSDKQTEPNRAEPSRAVT